MQLIVFIFYFFIIMVQKLALIARSDRSTCSIGSPKIVTSAQFSQTFSPQSSWRG